MDDNKNNKYDDESLSLPTDEDTNETIENVELSSSAPAAEGNNDVDESSPNDVGDENTPDVEDDDYTPDVEDNENTPDVEDDYYCKSDYSYEPVV